MMKKHSGKKHSSPAGGLPGIVRDMLRALGENPDRDGLKTTPDRTARSLLELTGGYKVDVDRLVRESLFKVPYSEMVVVKDIPFYSLCEHHLLPFFGRAHVAYVPDGNVIGLSKIPRLVEAFSKRLQVQERLTSEIARTLQRGISPLGVGVVMEARHLCMEMRGANAHQVPIVTSAMLGVFRRDPRTRQEFLGLIKG